MVHRRQVDDETLIFGVHGALWGNAMTWWDHSTGSVWSQPFGEAILGPRKGQRLELMSSQFTTWQSWLESNPETLALAVPAGPSGFDLSVLVLVVDFGDEARSYPVETLRSVGVANDVVADVPIAVVIDPTDPDRWDVFSRVLDDDVVVELAVDGGVLVDEITGSRFDPVIGQALDGPLRGQTLNRLPAFTSFAGDVETFWPDAEVWEP